MLNDNTFVKLTFCSLSVYIYIHIYIIYKYVSFPYTRLISDYKECLCKQASVVKCWSAADSGSIFYAVKNIHIYIYIYFDTPIDRELSVITLLHSPPSSPPWPITVASWESLWCCHLNLKGSAHYAGGTSF